MLVSHKESAVPPSELVGSDTGQLGPLNNSRVSNIFYSYPTAVISTTSNSSVTGQACSGDTGGSGTAIQGGNSRDYPIINELCLPDFLGREKRRGTKTSNQPESFESICASGALQIGGFTPTTRSTPTRGLDSENGLEGCLPPNPYPLKLSTPSPIHLGEEALQVLVPPIWPLLSDPSFHKSAETSGGIFKADRPTPDCIPGRHVVHAYQQRPARSDGTSDLKNFRGPGVDGKYQEISFKSNPACRVSGFSHQLSNNEIQPTIRERQENTTRSSKSAQVSVNFSTTPSYLHSKSSSNFQSCNAGPPTLQNITESTQLHNFWEQPPGSLG